MRSTAWDRHFAILAYGDIALPEIQTTLRGCALAKNGKDFVALPPKASNQKDAAAVQWNIRGKFAFAVRDGLMDAYKRMGGVLPGEEQPIERRIVPARFSVHEDADDGEAVEGLARTLSVEHQEAFRVLG